MSDYKASGVDREAAASWVENLKPEIQKTYRPEILSAVGGFGALFEAPQNYREPVWVATTDGVGTKLLLAEQAGDAAFFSMGIDAVAMCVNDLLACRAEPVIFLDYLALDRLHGPRMNRLLAGVIEGCRQAGCSLVGGETAEMPGFYPKNRMDIAGFSLGVLEKSQIWKRENFPESAKLIGFRSDGFHSNGFSLVRKVMEKEGWDLNSEIEGQILGDYLLRPTKIYVKDLLPWVRRDGVFAAAHITGGGFTENLPRVFPSNLQVRIDSEGIPTDSIMMSFLERAGCSHREGFSTWNMGIGFVLIAEPKLSQEILGQFPDLAIEMGVLEKKSGDLSVILE